MNILKHVLPVCMALCFTCSALTPLLAHADDDSDDDSLITIDTDDDLVYEDFTYVINDDGDSITLTSLDTAATEAEIPTEIDGIPVTAIGDACFMSCNFLTDVTVPEGIISIGESAFASCTLLCTVVLPDSATDLGAGMFEGDTMLSDFTFPSGITEIPEAFFYECSYFYQMTLPDTITSIGNEAFYGCSYLDTIELSENLESIGNYAFQGCDLLTSITIPASCTDIGIYAFDGCQSLTSFTVEEGNTAYTAIDGVLMTEDESTIIRYPAAKEDTSYTVPDACTTLEDWSFIGSTLLEEIDLGNVTSIGEDCFYYCTSLTDITLPEGITELVGATFAYCVALTSLTLPDSMVSLGEYCFYACASLEEIVIPEGVTTLGDYCFYSCASLLDITLPSTITEVGEMALGFYISADSEETEKIDLLNVTNNGSAAVEEYMAEWETWEPEDDGIAWWVWVIIIAAVVVVAAVIVILVLVHRSRNKIRPAKGPGSRNYKKEQKQAKKENTYNTHKTGKYTGNSQKSDAQKDRKTDKKKR